MRTHKDSHVNTKLMVSGRSIRQPSRSVSIEYTDIFEYEG